MGDQHMQAANQFLEAAAAQDAVLAQALAHVQMRVTDEGLIIEIFSRPEAPLFSPDGVAGDILRILAPVMVELFDIVTNPLALKGHVRSEPVMVAEETRWHLSADHAQQMRILLEEAGFDPRRITRVTGYADRRPAIPDLMSPRNDRVELILLIRP
jgi:chemotaxis protein MotB